MQTLNVKSLYFPSEEIKSEPSVLVESSAINMGVLVPAGNQLFWLTLSQGPFSVSCSAFEEVHEELGGSMAGTADLNWPKGYSMEHCAQYIN